MKEKIAQLKYSCEDYLNVVQLLKTNKRRIERECSVLQQTLAQSTKDEEEGKAASLEVEAQVDGEQWHIKKLSEELTILKESVTRLRERTAEKQVAIKRAISHSLSLEREVKEILDSNVASGKKGAKLQHENQKEISSSIFVRLQNSQVEVQELEEELSECTHEYERIVQQQDGAKESLAILLQDRKEIIRAIGALQKEGMYCNERLVQNAIRMKELREDKVSDEGKRDELMATLEELKQKRIVLEQRSSVSTQKFDKLVFQMRQVLEELMHQAKGTSILRSIRKRSKKQLLRAKSLASNAIAVCDEQMEILHSLQIEQQKSKEALDTLSTHMSSSLLVSANDFVKNALEARLQNLEAREYRVRQKIDATIHILRQETSLSESLNAHILFCQKNRVNFKEEFSNKHHCLTVTRSTQQALENKITEVLSSTNHIILQSKEGANVQSVMLRSEVMKLQRSLAVELWRGRELQRHFSSSNVQLRQALSSISDAERSREEMESKYLALMTEVQSMEKELAELRHLSENEKGQQKSTEIAKHILTTASKKLLEHVIEVAETEELLKGEVAVQEAKLEAEQQRLLVTVHLEKNHLSSMVDKHNCAKKKLDLLIMRYKESLESLSRLANSHDASFILKDSRNTSETSATTHSSCAGVDLCTALSPEELHARFLLQQSCERELLLTRGNYLDKKVVRLAKEVKGLKKILTTMRRPQSSSLLGISREEAFQEVQQKPRFADASTKMEVVCDRSSTGKLVESLSFPSMMDEIRQLELCDEERAVLLKEELELCKEGIREIEWQRKRTQQNLREMKGKLNEARRIHHQKRLQLAKLQEDARKIRSREVPISWR